jgi:hypothetical protein
VLAGVSAVALAIASCSGGTASDAAAGHRVVTWAVGTEPDSMDIAVNGNAAPALGLVMDQLERLGGDGSLTPNLATAVTTPDDTTIVYHLRRNVRFSRGRPLALRVRNRLARGGSARDRSALAGQLLIHSSITGSTWLARVAGRTDAAGRDAVIPVVTGRAYRTGEHRFLVDPDDDMVPGVVLR